MSDDYKPLNPNSKVKEGRLQGVLFFVNKVYSTAFPSFAETIKVEDRANANLECEFPKVGKVTCMSGNFYKAGWSFMRPVNSFDNNDIIMMTGMAAREERDPLPRRLFIFRVGDVESQEINTKIGPMDASFFSMDNQDNWEKFSCGPADVGMAIRSICTGAVDPDIQNGPFKSYLATVISGEMPKIEEPKDEGDGWFDDIPM